MEKSFDRDSVKIHATVMNSKWKSEREGPKHEGGKWKKKRNDDEAIDVRSILSVSFYSCLFEKSLIPSV